MPTAAAGTGLVFNIQKYSLHDGPGIRTIVFLKGCPLRCLWCANPEGLLPVPQTGRDNRACLGCGACAAACPAGLHRMRPGPDGIGPHRGDRAGACLGCGACVAACPAGALTLWGRPMTVAEVLDVVSQDEAFYRTSGGGVTLGGGEAGLQPAFAGALLAACRDQGFHTALETCGCLPWPTLAALAGRADLTLYDLKHANDAAHTRLTGRSNATILDNLGRLARTGAALLVRLPLVPGYNDDPAALTAALDRIRGLCGQAPGFQGVELLPYHAFGAGKYDRLGLAYPLAGLRSHTPAALAALETLARASDLPVTLVRPQA
ncbi:Pyruvate formate-lyase activating enzyme [Desulfovibrio sp. DV]|uniref:glycyl-radical enzyme activating protein n=1 Tax=Desulfovibrio sp. DV TaxID=1844708 RepID=UPI00094B8933|nr:glycyl-radical enzyme activating protein [Desulfovibrio sp. DV]OLN29992.1 Pyruvate formate-lyase activating enzyme [Desulfovibrio sp. DV]